MDLATFNALDADEAEKHVMHWCHCPSWAGQVLSKRPYESIAALAETAADLWDGATQAQRLEAFAAHPLIGDVVLLRQKYADTARAEQGQVMDADDTTLQALAELNVAYKDKFGFIFIVFASGKSADEMLALLRQRIDNTPAQELAIAADEQARIMLLRLRQTFEEPIQ